MRDRFEASDFFRGRDLIADPYGYFDWLRAQCPVHREPHHDVMMVTGYDEAAAIYAEHLDVLVVQLPDRTLPGVPGALARATTSAT